jgi:signal transduction histidine kinase
MSGKPILDWATLAVSLYNTVVLFWLGLTVLLNARRKSWGVWLAGGGLLLGGVFFVSHTVLLDLGLDAQGPAVNAWWALGWAAVIVSPYLWYVVMLWYAGYWNPPPGGRTTKLRRRQKYWFPLITALFGLLVIGLLAVFPLPSFEQVVTLDLSAARSVAGIPVLLLVYPAYILLCIVLSLRALRHAESSAEWLSEHARQRARPRLLESTRLLLAVSLWVAFAMGAIVAYARLPVLRGRGFELGAALAVFDLGVASTIAIVVLTLGQAIVAYEIFTGEALPRRGFARQWRAVLWIAAGVGIVAGASLVYPLRPIYVLLPAALLMAILSAVSAWRSFTERERTIAQLRPFASSQRLYDALLAPSPPTADVDVSAIFDALCGDVLAVERAYLFALGPLASLIGSALAYPGDARLPELPPELEDQFDSPRTVCVPLDPADGLVWAVPLWSERGLIGVFFLGAKRDGGLYTREEIEIARAGGERLIDTLATAQVSARLMALLRQRIAQVKVMEGQGRRVLHDQVLPQLHAAILHLGGLPNEPAVQQAVEALTAAHRQISDLMHDTASTAPRLLAEKGLLAALRALVEGEFEGLFERVSWTVSPGGEQAAAERPLYVNEVLFFAAQELVRNAARHAKGGEPQRPVRIKIVLEPARLVVEDDGVGLSATRLPTDEAGAHNGLRFHSTMLAAVGASLEVVERPGDGTRAVIGFPRSPGSERESHDDTASE